jgi:hypothetical protein
MNFRIPSAVSELAKLQYREKIEREREREREKGTWDRFVIF